MKTKLPEHITTIEQAKAYLKDLYDNGESYHPDDDAHSIAWDLPEEDLPTAEYCDKLNDLMDQISELKGFDPCEYLLQLDGHIMETDPEELENQSEHESQ